MRHIYEPTKVLTTAGYRAKLSAHDWSFEFSDDQRAWHKGNASLAELKTLQTQFDHDFSIWNSVAPEPYRRSAPSERRVWTTVRPG